MKEWIFKAVYLPIGVILAICCAGVLVMIFKDVGWEQPFRWLVIIGAIALIADKAVNP